MFPADDRRIKKNRVGDFEADRAKYQLILQDMVRNAGPLMPSPNWLSAEDSTQPAETYDPVQALEYVLSDAHFNKLVARLDQMMDAWIGGAEPSSKREIAMYHAFLKGCDELGLWATNVEEPGALPLIRADFGSLMDLTLLYGFTSTRGKSVTTVLDVGGGYGRLAEAMFNVFGRSVRYVMLDAVPASLYYAKEYLVRACPDARVASYYDSADGKFDFTQHDISIFPAWQFERFNTLRYDICINIESMQEMNQRHVDYFLNLFDSVAADDATIYISNAHDYFFRGSFQYPSHWQKLFCGNTPRSWRTDHPTEIFRNTKKEFSTPNRIIDSLHQFRLVEEIEPVRCINRNSLLDIGVPLFKKLVRPISSRIRKPFGR